MKLNTPCIVIPGRFPEGTFGVILQMLLRARLDLRLDVTGSQFYEEDVNTYLGGVLVSYIDPQYLRAISDLLTQHDVDLHQAIDRATPDKAQMYRIYKVNADDLMLSVGVFHVGQEQPLDRIKEYYSCASEFQKRIYGKPTAVAEIQSKLAGSAGRYLAILTQARREYLNFVRQVSDENLSDLLK